MPTPASLADSFPSVSSPLDLFQRWYDEAIAAGVSEPEVMALATATPDGAPSVRYVLLRGVNGGGLRFFTNRDSRKGDELARNPRASAAFYWAAVYRQVRFEGRIEPLTAAEDDDYFHARPRGHQLAAVASPQSQPITRAALEARFAELERVYPDRAPIPRPPHWGGYRLVPTQVEFWAGQANRLHARQRHRLVGTSWTVDMLAP